MEGEKNITTTSGMTVTLVCQMYTKIQTERICLLYCKAKKVEHVDWIRVQLQLFLQSLWWPLKDKLVSSVFKLCDTKIRVANIVYLFITSIFTRAISGKWVKVNICIWHVLCKISTVVLASWEARQPQSGNDRMGKICCKQQKAERSSRAESLNIEVKALSAWLLGVRGCSALGLHYAEKEVITG